MSLRKVLEENVSGYDTSVMFSILGQVVELLKQDSAPEIPLEWSLPGLATFPCLAGPSFNTRIIECNYLPSQNWHLDLCILGYSVTSVHFLAYRPLVPTLAFSVQAAQFLDPIANLWLVSQLPAIETFQCKLRGVGLRGSYCSVTGWALGSGWWAVALCITYFAVYIYKCFCVYLHICIYIYIQTHTYTHR